MTPVRRPEAPRRTDIGKVSAAVIATICAPVLLITGIILAQSTEPLVAGIGLETIALVVGIGVLTIGGGAFDPLGPAAFITYSHVLLFLLRPLYGLIYQDSINIFTQQPFDSSAFTAQAIAAGGYISLTVGLRLGFNRSVNTRETSIQVANTRHVRPAAWFIAVVGVALYSIYIYSTGWQTYLSILTTGRTSESSLALEGSSAYFYSGLNIATGSLILIFLVSLRESRRLTTIAALILLALFSVPSFASGTRSVFIPTLAAIIVILRIHFPRGFSVRRLAAWLPLAFILLFIAPRLWRGSLSEGASLTQSLSDAFLPQNYLEGFLGSYDTAMLDSFSLQVQAQADGLISPQFGNTYLSLIVSVVPRAAWPDKPVTVDQVLNSQLFPATSAQGVGFSFGFYSEPYLNFGVAGVIMVCLIFGFLVARGYANAISSSSLVNRYSAIMTSAYLFALMRGSISYDAQRLIIAMIPTILAIWIARSLATAPIPARSFEEQR